MFGKKHIEKISRFKALHPVNYRQFSFEKISKFMTKNNFSPFFILDEATNFFLQISKAKSLLLIEKYYVMVGIKNE